MIAGEIRRFMRDNGAIKVSRSIKDNRAAVNRSREQLLEKLGREPTLSEIVKDVGMSMEDVLLAVNSGQEVASLQQTIYDGDGSSIRLMDKLSARSGEGDAALDRMMLADLFLLRRTAGLSIFFLIFTFVPCPDVEVTSSSSINASINVKAET